MVIITFLTMYNKNQFFTIHIETTKNKSKYFTGKKIQENPAYVQYN